MNIFSTNVYPTLKKYIPLIYTTIIEYIAPAYCAQCMVFLSEHTVLCRACLDDIQPITSTTIPITNTHAVKVFAIAAYKEPLKKLILAKSYSNIAASNQLGLLMWQHTTISHALVDTIVPIPLHWTRFASRGYNQADEIAQVLSKKSGKPVIHVLQRVKRTRYQAELESASRQDNVKNAFILTVKDPSLFEGKHILLVDDLMTTGATVRVAAKELLKLKPASISVVVACRVI